MGKIKKTATARHEATISPAIKDFIKTATSVPLPKVPLHLESFPRLWPFPRGDLYHWIPLLDRFDTILERFNQEYGLSSGRQRTSFARALLEKGDGEPANADGSGSDEDLSRFSTDGDRELIQAILDFTVLLLENCGNRSLYASSHHLDALLNTTSLPLLRATLNLSLRLAQRYHAARARTMSPTSNNLTLLASHYSITLDNVQRIASPFACAQPTANSPVTPSFKGKEKAATRAMGTASPHPSDLVALIKGGGMNVGQWTEWQTVSISYYDEPVKTTAKIKDACLASVPAHSPTRSSRPSNLGPNGTSGPNGLPVSDAVQESPSAHVSTEATNGTRQKHLEITQHELVESSAEDLVSKYWYQLPEDPKYEYDLLHKIRTAKALGPDTAAREDAVAVRLLAIANLAYVYQDPVFRAKIAGPDSEEGRSLQLAYQLTDLVQLPAGSVSVQLQTVAFQTLMALTRTQSRALEVTAALSINVGHGVFFYVLRQAIQQLSEEEHVVDLAQQDWRDALFDLINGIHNSQQVHRAGEQMVSAGLLTVLLEVLQLRTSKAERSHAKIVLFLDNFIISLRDAFTQLVQARGLDVVADLCDWVVLESLKRALEGHGISENVKTQMTDYQIPYFQQQTMKALFKFINHMMQHNAGVHDRVLRNLIDSPQLLVSLRVVLQNASIFGSGVWSSAATILASFIHNEPTSYVVVAEAGLSRALLETIIQQQISQSDTMSPQPQQDEQEHSTAHDEQPDSQPSHNVVAQEIPPTQEQRDQEGDLNAENYEEEANDEEDEDEEDEEDEDEEDEDEEPSSTPNEAPSGPSSGPLVQPDGWRFTPDGLSLPGPNDDVAGGILPVAETILAIPHAFGAICLNEKGKKLFQESGALQKFFDVFVSAKHIKAMDVDPDTAYALGTSFDEIVRHHPTLKDNVLKCVLDMVARVGILCSERAVSGGAGTKLWKTNSEGDLLVAGGKSALSGNPVGMVVSTAYNADVEMTDIDSNGHLVEPKPTDDVSIRDILETELPKKTTAIMEYVSVVCRFLRGFLVNATTCSAFLMKGGLEFALDLATLPSMPYNFDDSFVHEMSCMIQLLVDSKPFLTLPAIMRRVQAATEDLQPLLDYTSDRAFFSVFTDPQQNDSLVALGEKNAPEVERGTCFVKALVKLHMLCPAMYKALSTSNLHARQPGTLFTQVNLTDLYVRLIDRLGKIQRSCIWEEILLLNSMPKKWEDPTKVSSGGLGSEEADAILHFTRGDDNSSAPSDEPLQRQATDMSTASKEGEEHSAQLKNTRTLRCVFSRMITAINPFFFSLGKILLARRPTDTLMKQNAVKVGEALAKSAIDQLRFENPSKTTDVESQYKYWIVAVTIITQLMIDPEVVDRTSPQTLTLVLLSFKNQGGLCDLGEILHKFFDEVRSNTTANGNNEDKNESGVNSRLSMGGMRLILVLYSYIINSKFVTEAVQTTALTSRVERERDKPDYFHTGQFLVELRTEVVRQIRPLWESDAMETATIPIIKALIEILQLTLSGETEVGASKRADKVIRSSKSTTRKWTPRPENLERLSTEGFDVSLVKEALFRCYDNVSNAREYCLVMTQHSRSALCPIPVEEVSATPQSSSSEVQTTANTPTQPVLTSTDQLEEDLRTALLRSAARNRIEAQAPAVSDGDSRAHSATRAQDVPQDQTMESMRGQFNSFNAEVTELLAKTSPGVTIEDLNEERSLIREGLIDVSLNVLSSHEDATFELADLIAAAASKASEPTVMRQEIGSTLVQSLVSLQTDDDVRPDGKKVGAYAHLLALILNDEKQDFYTATVDELKTYLPVLLGFIKIYPNHNGEEPSNWIGQILAVMEKLLSQDCVPHEIKWNMLEEAKASEDKVAEAPEPVVNADEKQQLLDALLIILPKIGKDSGLALSVLRTFVILTRSRSLAVKLAEKQNLNKLFFMIKQLAGHSNERIQSAFLIVLRHMVEDNETIRQIMRSEIQSLFDSGARRTLTTQTYPRSTSQLIIRSPDIFLEITNEMVMISRLDSGSATGAHSLQLKPTEKPELPPIQTSTDDDLGVTTSAVDEPAETPSKANEKPPLSRMKTSDLKHPTVEHPDGIIHFLLSELLKYKDTDDPEEKVTDAVNPQPTQESDVQMTNGESIDQSGVPAPQSAQAKVDKPVFKAENHPIYVYRCFILHCLEELLSSYNRAKIEFINFSRKSDPKESTPMKPRSTILNYILTSLVPTGTINPDENAVLRKTYWTSTCASNVIVALTQKTKEQKYLTPSNVSDFEDEPELVYVRKFVLESALKAFKDAQASNEPLDLKYSRLLGLANLFNSILVPKASTSITSPRSMTAQSELSQKQLGRIMYEKNYIAALTSAIADIDLNFPNVKRAVKYILKPLKLLTQVAIGISTTTDIAPSSSDEDEISTEASSVSGVGDGREQTPDLFRNSALGIGNPNQDEDSESDSEDDEDEDGDEAVYVYDDGEEMDYEGEHDDDEVVSDEDEVDIGPIEGLPGDVNMVEVDMMGDGPGIDDMSGSDENSEDSDDEEEDDEELMNGTADLEGMDEDGIDIEEGEDDWGTEEEDGADFPGQHELEDEETHEHMHHMMHMVVEDGGPEALLQELTEGQLVALAGNDFHGGDLQEMDEGDDEDEEEDEFDDEGIEYEAEFDDDDDIMHYNEDGMPWEDEWGGAPPPGAHGLPILRTHHSTQGHHHRQHAGLTPWGMIDQFAHRNGRFIPTGHARRGGPPPPRNNNLGFNPLLRREPRQAEGGDDWTELPGTVPRIFRGDGGPVSFITNLINSLAPGAGVGPDVDAILEQHEMELRLSLGNTMIAGMPPGFPGLGRPTRFRTVVEQTQRIPRDDPGSAVAFASIPTSGRWHEEARILFDVNVPAMAQRVLNSVLKVLVPPAHEAQKIREQKKKEEEDARRAKEAADKAEREAKEKQALEEREAKEKKEREEKAAAAAAEAARLAAEAAARGETEPATTQQTVAESEGPMEGVESTRAEASTQTALGEPTERIIISVGANEIDITHLGIDLEYLEALPEDIRNEVLLQQIQQQRAEQQTSQTESSNIDEAFLAALPQEMREELLEQEAQERRRAEREETRRRAAGRNVSLVDDLDPADFLASLDPGMRQAILIEQDEDTLQLLPEHLRNEARALAGERRLYVRRRGLPDSAPDGNLNDAVTAQRKVRRPVIQMLDKAGVATLLRLMFISQQGTSRQSLNGILRDVCENRVNRAEVISGLLSILQDGSNDVGAVERSFAHLSIRAKSSPTNAKTPQPLKRSISVGAPLLSSDMSPIMVVQQCLNTLVYLVQNSSHIPLFFLTEHETITGFKSRSAKKGKAKESKSNKYPLNALLGLLDRKLVVESAPTMEQLASLLQTMTHPLGVLLRKEKAALETPEKKDEARTNQSADQHAEHSSPSVQGAPAADMSVSVVMTDAPLVDESTQAVDHAESMTSTTAHEAEAAPTEAGPSHESADKPQADSDGEKKEPRRLEPPEVPEHNLRLVVNIMTAPECSSKTFRETLNLIINLSAIPGAREIFGRELIKQAQGLGEEILVDLRELSKAISKAKSGNDVQGMALAKFSPASSHQTKLLRVMTALDYLFDPKRAENNKPFAAEMEGLPQAQKEDILTELYENSTFGPLWTKLSECLTQIREREGLLNVAQILLPAIEALMVVCKNTELSEVPLAKTISREMTVTSPPPESRIENLFFTFTEEHRKVLNELVRDNPKLMSGNFALLVRNSKVLEFDNKRNYFSRKLHSRGSPEVRQPHPPLTLSVRRDQVFLDSFKALYFKTGNEMKFGKLNIRFHGEDGVDAGGVTREWFQVLAKQMFNEDYALFNRVASDRTTFHPNPLSVINPEHLTFFRFIGRIIGKALYEGRVLDCHFSRAVYRKMLGKSVTIKDIESIDPDYYNSLVWMLENEIENSIFETLSVEADNFGATKVIDLIEDGRNIQVTDENKQEYVQLLAEWKMIGSVNEQLDNFLSGFHDIVPKDLIGIFNEQELELLISGLPEIDVDDWKNNTDYQNYTAAAPQIQWFWRAVRSFDKEERAKLLQFVTGTSKVPLNGFKELEGMNGFSRFNIHRDFGATNRLPSSHTCFNQLDLPEYETYESLRSHVYTAITAGSEYFGFA